MGYTNYYEQDRDFTDEEWSNICDAASRLFAIAQDPAKHGLTISMAPYAYVMLADSTGEPDTQPTLDSIGMNGIEVIHFNGTCLRDNDESHDSCEVYKHPAKHDAWKFCKTARKPYNAYVIALYEIARHFSNGCFTYSSDGDDEEGWSLDGKHLAQVAIGSKPRPSVLSTLHAR